MLLAVSKEIPRASTPFHNFQVGDTHSTFGRDASWSTVKPSSLTSTGAAIAERAGRPAKSGTETKR